MSRVKINLSSEDVTTLYLSVFSLVIYHSVTRGIYLTVMSLSAKPPPRSKLYSGVTNNSCSLYVLLLNLFNDAIIITDLTVKRNMA